MHDTKNLFTIPPGIPFLKRLAQFVLNNEFGDKSVNDNALELSNTIIYLPTRRAVRLLRQEFSNLSGSNAAFLPTLRTLGDSDEEDFGFSADIDIPEQPSKTVSPLERQIQMARLVKHWIGAMGIEARELFKDEDIVIPSSSAEALWLSSQVCELIDQMHTEEISWEGLKDLVPLKSEYGNWWQLTLDFLQIAMKTWPEHLAQFNACDAAANRRHLLDMRTKLLKQKTPPGRIIAAGSTGSIPATARFLKAVCELPNGAVVLPGLDKALADEDWNEIGNKINTGALSRAQTATSNGCEDHPQYGLSNLLDIIGVPREKVVELAKPDLSGDTRAKLVSIALMPGSRTGQWREMTAALPAEHLASAIHDITIIEAPAERQEAMAIALVLREQIEIPDSLSALVTPDRKLARRVAAELKRFGLDIDDSGGSALAATPNAILLRLMISVTTLPPDATTLASFIKHPMLKPDYTDTDALPVARFFEVCLLRDALEIPDTGEFASAAQAIYDTCKQDNYSPPLIKAASEEDWQNLFSFCRDIDSILSPLVSINAQNKEMGLVELFNILNDAATSLTTMQDGSAGLFSHEHGQELANLLEGLTDPQNNGFKCKPGELLAVFDALIAPMVVRSARNTHPRISILGPLEARLQPLDCVVLGGLNEGTWPARYDSGPFLNRPMKTTLNLSTPERRTGLAAHDFEQLLGTAKVFLTRASRLDNAPTVPSRWLQRLGAVCGETITQHMTDRGAKYLSWANQLDKPQPSNRVERPCPTPPVEHRPTRLSVTEIETWIRDPYAIYAKRILRLQPLAKIGTSSIHAVYGMAWHEALAEFVSSYHDHDDSNAVSHLIELVERQLTIFKIPDHLKALWMPRINEIAQDFVKYEQDQAPDISADYCEIDGKILLANGAFELRGRADRITRMNNGDVHIIDYKTGTYPTLKMARTLSPQLALEGAMVSRGGFAQLGKATPSSLRYVRLRPHGEFKSQSVEDTKPPVDATELSTQKLTELEELFESYKNPDQGYLSRFAVELSQNIEGDYDHLARVREWSWGTDDAEEEAG